jgi:hypothetical protein
MKKISNTLIYIATSFIVTASAVTAGEWVNLTTNKPPLPTITLAKFAKTNESFEINTANAAGLKTFWSGSYSISTAGVITGSATVETYDVNGVLKSKSKVTISTGSKLSSATKNITPVNSKWRDNSDGTFTQAADYYADAIIKFSNGFIVRGKVNYEHYLDIQQSEGGITGYNDSEIFEHLSITGPNGHIGFIVTAY